MSFSFTVTLRLARAERSLERVLGVAGRRGCEVIGMKAALDEEQKHLDVELTLSSERPADVLVRQLSRLREVEDIACTFARPAVG